MKHLSSIASLCFIKQGGGLLSSVRMSSAYTMLFPGLARIPFPDNLKIMFLSSMMGLNTGLFKIPAALRAY